ncbi:MAG: hypothetical protein O3A25_09785 [Acidobacteria bacterium]|nr:hypothetical protein [Acidobacteriota bacterium]
MTADDTRVDTTVDDAVRRVLDPLSPPSNGVARLRTRIARDAVARRRGRRVQAALGALLLTAAAGWATLGRGPNPAASSPELDLVRMSLGQIAAPTEPLTLSAASRLTAAVHRVPLPTDQVVFYLLGSIQD